MGNVYLGSGKFRIKKWGKDRIVRELKMRQISPYNIKIALKEIPEEEYLTTLAELAEKFWASNAHRSLLLRKKKVIDALRYRGWESHLIYEMLTTLENNLKAE